MTSPGAITTRGVVARSALAPIQVEDVLVGEPGPNELRVRILATGLCHSDLHCAHGVFGQDFPYLLGHEAAGIVEQVGEGVVSPAEGSYVALAWHAPCGECVSCMEGRPNHCLQSLAAPSRMVTREGLTLTAASTLGTFCTHTVVAASQAIPIPTGVPPTSACLVGCAVATGVGAALQTARVRPGSSVAVFGCGGVGINVIQGARIAGAQQIVAVDLADEKLELARQFGATETINGSDGDAVTRVQRLTGKRGVDYCFEVAGSTATLEQAIACIAVHGTCVIVGVPAQEARLSLAVDELYWHAGTIVTSWYGDCVPARDFPMLFGWYLDGSLKLDELVTRTIELEAAPEAMAQIGGADTLRSVIKLQ